MKYYSNFLQLSVSACQGPAATGYLSLACLLLSMGAIPGLPTSLNGSYPWPPYFPALLASMGLVPRGPARDRFTNIHNLLARFYS